MVLALESCDPPCCGNQAVILTKSLQTLLNMEVQKQQNAPLTIFSPALPRLPSKRGLQQVLSQFSSYVAFFFLMPGCPSAATGLGEA